MLKDGTHVKGNGYRSLLQVLNSLLLQLHQILQKCAKERSSMFFLPGDLISNLTAYSRALEVYPSTCISTCIFACTPSKSTTYIYNER